MKAHTIQSFAVLFLTTLAFLPVTTARAQQVDYPTHRRIWSFPISHGVQMDYVLGLDGLMGMYQANYYFHNFNSNPVNVSWDVTVTMQDGTVQRFTGKGPFRLRAFGVRRTGSLQDGDVYDRHEHGLPVAVNCTRFEVTPANP